MHAHHILQDRALGITKMNEKEKAKEKGKGKGKQKQTAKGKGKETTRKGKKRAKVRYYSILHRIGSYA